MSSLIFGGTSNKNCANTHWLKKRKKRGSIESFVKRKIHWDESSCVHSHSHANHFRAVSLRREQITYSTTPPLNARNTRAPKRIKRTKCEESKEKNIALFSSSEFLVLFFCVLLGIHWIVLCWCCCHSHRFRWRRCFNCSS